MPEFWPQPKGNDFQTVDVSGLGVIQMCEKREIWRADFTE